MNAPDRVWSGISKELQKRRRRVNWTMAASFIILSGLGYLLVTNSVKQLPQPVATNQQPAATEAVALPPAEISLSAPSPQNNFIPKAPTRRKPNTTRSYPAALPQVADQPPVIEPEAREVAPVNISGMAEPEATAAATMVPVATQIDYNKADLSAENLVAAIDNGEAANEIATAAQAIAAKTREKDLETALQALASAPAEAATVAVKPLRKKIDWQLALTPNISYRKLGENRSYLRTPGGGSLLQPAGFTPLYSVNSAVTHKPDLGFELGITAKYRLTNSIRITGGLQFNVNRYDIKAFDAPYAVATIRLNGNNGVSAVNTMSNFSNYNGYNTNWLKNLYFQASAPVGVELRLKGDDRVQFGMATTVQPSYLLGDRAYLITSDYKSYVRVPWLVRRWNANTNFHTFVSYYTGKVKWQVGPQVRYQLLSSFVTEYPVKENLFDFGMRIGVSLGKD